MPIRDWLAGAINNGISKPMYDTLPTNQMPQTPPAPDLDAATRDNSRMFHASGPSPLDNNPQQSQTVEYNGMQYRNPLDQTIDADLSMHRFPRNIRDINLPNQSHQIDPRLIANQNRTRRYMR